jgi:hypothetical protein
MESAPIHFNMALGDFYFLNECEERIRNIIAIQSDPSSILAMVRVQILPECNIRINSDWLIASWGQVSLGSIKENTDIAMLMATYSANVFTFPPLRY